ncbi:MAG: hypothetical protein H3C43_07605 [Leptonema sp. (in: Bacteria)]|nr:hypothetical protein [Leptonema sp. (in: bacteria)]
MTKRIYKSKFSTYVIMISQPFLIGGLLLAVYPKPILPLLLGDQLEASGGLHLLIRMTGTLSLFTGITLLFMRREPDRNRELAFWQSIFCLGLAGLLGSSPWLFGISYWALAVSVYLLISGVFLFVFASRNLLVRE